ncbi:hypothetical protein ILUMI_16303 [Ignelater luminosus]|uniref:Uncharacterized protein n=1 Tax=Ignelater luminosus TaxID=2038154 RepID=A0A8K0CUP7_IGNLU|nr:hypothetical protein ILUMI_16303 [Ignelater luminosus]
MGVKLNHYLPLKIKIIMMLLLILVSCSALLNAYPASSVDDRFPEREQYINSPGAHQLASWLTLQMRRNEYPSQQQELPVIPYRVSGIQGKRNSELTNSMMGIPRNMIDNGKK